MGAMKGGIDLSKTGGGKEKGKKRRQGTRKKNERRVGKGLSEDTL